MKKTSKKVKGLIIALIVLAIIFVPIALFFAVDFYHYSKVKSPHSTLFIPWLETGLFDITSLTADRADIRAKMLIHSPLPFNIAADSMQFKIYVSGVEVIKNTFKTSINIKKWDSTWITLPVSIYQDKLFTILRKEDKRGKDSVVYRIQSTFYTHLPFKKTFVIDIETLQPLFYMPTAKVLKVDYDSLSGKGVTLYIHLRIGNRNKFPFQFKDIQYKFAIANLSWVYGSIRGVMDIKAQDSTALTLPIRILFTDIFKGLGELIRKGGKTGFKFSAALTMVSKNNALKDTKIVVIDEGYVHELVALIKEEHKKAKAKRRSVKRRKTD